MNVCEICGEPGDQPGPFCAACLANDPGHIFVTTPHSHKGQSSISEDVADPESPMLGSRASSTRSHRSVAHRRAEVDQARSLVLQARAERMADQQYATVSLRPSQQAQMLSNFLDSHFPTAEARASLANRNSYLAALPDVHISADPLLRAAIDTLCFAHIGSKIGDQRLVRESQASYGKVLTTLIRATSADPGQLVRIEPKAVLTSVMLLALYDDSIPSHTQKLGDWGTHFWGIQQLLQAYGPSVLNMSEPFDRLIFRNLRSPLLFVAVARRKSVVMGEPRWLALAEANFEARTAHTDFYRVSFQVPGLLERTDQVAHGKAALKDVLAVISDIERVRTEIVAWYDSKVNAPNGKLDEVPDTFNVLNEPDAFNTHIEEHRVIALSDTFRSMYRYKTPGHVLKDHTYFIMLSLLLDCTILRIFHFRPTIAVVPKDCMSWDETCRSAYENASNLCRSVYHYSQFPGLPYVDLSNFLVEMAQNFFEEVGASKETKWCRDLRNALHQRRERIKRTTQSRTLCRMAEAGPGFAAAMHFRKTKIALG